MQRPFLIGWVLLLSFLSSSPLQAETKVLTAEGTYTMGEGETMTFAESMALQKAKQTALEQAGTYMESFTKVQNYQLTAEEIQTIAGGVLQTEVLEKNRELIGDGIRLFVKIKATVTTDRVAELVQRIKDKNVTEEYKKLQGDYARLTKEIEAFKEVVAKTPTGSKRTEALDKIREGEKVFAVIQKREGIFFERLISGEALFSKAQAILDEKRVCAQKRKDALGNLYRRILSQGYVITVGEPEINMATKNPEEAELTVPMTVTVNNAMRSEVAQANNLLCGKLGYAEYRDFETRLNNLMIALEGSQHSGDSHACYINTLGLNMLDIDEDRLLLEIRSLRFKATMKVPLNKLREFRAIRGKLIDEKAGYSCVIHDQR